MKFILVMVLLFLHSSLFAGDYNEYPFYDENKKYYRGDTVKHIQHLWMSKTFKNTTEPSISNRKWSRVKSETPIGWGKKIFFRTGDVVNFKNKHYYAKRFNFIIPTSYFSFIFWEELVYSGFGQVIPIISRDEAHTGIIGLDTNNNNIRDDFEAYILENSPTNDILIVNKAAGVLLGEAILLHAELPETIDYTYIMTIANNLAALIRCTNLLFRTNNRFKGLHGQYFNTPERLKAFMRVDALLYEVLSDSYMPVIMDDACEQVKHAGGYK